MISLPGLSSLCTKLLIMNECKNSANEGMPSFNLQTENELLKLKLNAEFGGSTHSIDNDTPPELLNAFLQNVYDFEKIYATQPSRILDEVLGYPELPDPDQCSDAELQEMVDTIIEKAQQVGVVLEMDVDVEAYVQFLFIRDYFLPLDIGPKMPANFCMYYSYSELLEDDDLL